MSNTYYLVMGIILFVLAAAAFVFGVLAIKSGKTLNGKYNKIRHQLSESEQKKRDKIIGFSYFILGIGAIIMGISALNHFIQPWNNIGLIVIAASIIIGIPASSNPK